MTNHLFLAVEGGGSGGSVPIIILVAGLAAFAIAYFVVGPGKRKGPKRHGDIPLSMRPYHSDEELETSAMERAMAWGVALAAFCALFLPLYWLIEPTRIDQRVDEFYAEDVEAGRELFADACASCHGADLGGGSAQNPDPDIDAPWPAPALNDIVARYEDSEIVDDVYEFIIMTLEEGRAGTPMPAFGVGAGGQYSDNQLAQMAAYILSVQTGEDAPEPDAQAFVGASGDELFSDHCVRCHGPNGEGVVGPQLLNLYERYGVDVDGDDDLDSAREVIRQAIVQGRNVPGKAPMPSFAQVLSDDAIDAIIEHVEGFQETGGPRYGQLGGDPTAAEGDDQ